MSLSSVGEPCMNYVRDIQEAQAEIFETLELLLEYIATSSDPAYWNLLFQEHRQKYEALELLKTKLTTSMTSFESALFARVIDYLMPFWERDITRCSLVRDDLI